MPTRGTILQSLPFSMSRRAFYLTFLPFVTLFLYPQSARSDVPRLINYQGLLQTAADSLLEGSIQIHFSIYGIETGGSPLWSESQTVEVSEGQFNVLLGSVSPIPDDLFSEGERYLSMAVEDDAELLPRQRILSVAYALHAAQAEDVSGRPISPSSVTLSGGKARLDTSGTLAIDSLVVGGVGLIDRTGNWTGPSVPARGLLPDSIIIRNVQDSLLIPPDSRWVRIAPLDVFFTLDRNAILDIQFSGSVSVSGGFQTRLSVEPRDPKGPLIVDFGNLSGIPFVGSFDLRFSSVTNFGYLSLGAAKYRLSVERRAQGGTGMIRTGFVLIRIYYE